MTIEHQRSNRESWDAVVREMEQHPDDAYWTPWKALARQFIRAGRSAGLDSYFRAGRSMHHFVFSTLDHHRLGINDPRVTVELHPTSELRIAYGKTNIWFGSPEIEYLLSFDEGFATFRRFLNQLWTATVPEPIPEELRGPLASLSAPVLPR